MLAPFINLLRDNFSTRISAKTGWGKNELMMEFERAVSETMAEVLEKENHGYFLADIHGEIAADGSRGKIVATHLPVSAPASDPKGRLPQATDRTGN